VVARLMIEREMFCFLRKEEVMPLGRGGREKQGGENISRGEGPAQRVGEGGGGRRTAIPISSKGVVGQREGG